MKPSLRFLLVLLVGLLIHTSAAAFSRIPPPTLSTPEANATVNTAKLRLTWNAPVGAIKYELEVAKDGGFTTVIYSTTTTFLADTTTEIADGHYFWRVRGLDNTDRPGQWSLVRRIAIDTTAPEAVRLVNPADGYLTSNMLPIFSWGLQRGDAKYEMVLGADESCTSRPLPEMEQRAYTPTKPLVQGTYYWCVRAIDAAGNIGPFSEPFTFSINLLKSPKDETLIISKEDRFAPTFKWVKAPDVTAYRLWLDDNPTFNSPLEVNLADVNSVTLRDPLAYGRYYWQIIPEGYRSREPVVWSFILTPPLPKAPKLEAPKDSVRLDTRQPELVWSAVDGADHYEIQLATDANFSQNLQVLTVDASNTRFIVPDVLPEKGYVWRVRAINPYGAPSGWSSARRFGFKS